MKVLAVDVGGSHVSCGAVEGNHLLEVVSLESDSSKTLASLLPVLGETLQNLSKRHDENFYGIGFGFCGLVDTAACRIVSTNHKYSDATSIDLTRWALDELNLPLILENDTRMALLGERHAGAAAGSDDAVMITIGTGIGSAAIMEGKLVRGKHFQAGCLGGHFTVELDGHICSCGARGCFEAEASTYALVGVIKQWPGIENSSLLRAAKWDFATLFAHADQGDAVAGQIRERCVKIWAACALSLVHAYDPEIVILGGGVSQSSFPILRRLQEHVDTYAWTPWGKVQFRLAALGSSAALLGALPMFQLSQQEKFRSG